jgi:hypothetical protein
LTNLGSIPTSAHAVVAGLPRVGYDEGDGARMNSVLFAIIIGVVTVVTMVVIQKVLDSPNH